MITIYKLNYVKIYLIEYKKVDKKYGYTISKHSKYNRQK